jgi:hypothetical protein
MTGRGSWRSIEQESRQMSADSLPKREPESDVITSNHQPRSDCFMLNRYLFHVGWKARQADFGMSEFR